MDPHPRHAMQLSACGRRTRTWLVDHRWLFCTRRMRSVTIRSPRSSQARRMAPTPCSPRGLLRPALRGPSLAASATEETMPICKSRRGRHAEWLLLPDAHGHDSVSFYGKLVSPRNYLPRPHTLDVARCDLVYKYDFRFECWYMFHRWWWGCGTQSAGNIHVL